VGDCSTRRAKHTHRDASAVVSFVARPLPYSANTTIVRTRLIRIERMSRSWSGVEKGPVPVERLVSAGVIVDEDRPVVFDYK
jgi:hypothetical protein